MKIIDALCVMSEAEKIEILSTDHKIELEKTVKEWNRIAVVKTLEIAQLGPVAGRLRIWVSRQDALKAQSAIELGEEK